MKNYLQLNRVNSYVISYHLSNYIWNKVVKWEYFSKETIGKQFVRAIDSISANIAEGFGRYGKKDKIRFYYFSFGSLQESLDWNQKAYNRNLLKQVEYEFIFNHLKHLPKEINSLIKYTKEKLSI